LASHVYRSQGEGKAFAYSGWPTAREPNPYDLRRAQLMLWRWIEGRLWPAGNSPRPGTPSRTGFAEPGNRNDPRMTKAEFYRAYSGRKDGAVPEELSERSGEDPVLLVKEQRWQI
jgi:hypothetical protein